MESNPLVIGREYQACRVMDGNFNVFHAIVKGADMDWVTLEITKGVARGKRSYNDRTKGQRIIAEKGHYSFREIPAA